MDQRKILYNKFLNDKDIYNLNVAYWRRKLEKSLKEKISESNQFIVNRNKYGKNFYDGNPIFSYVNSEKGKAIRIVQENPEDINHYSDIKLIEAWIDKVPFKSLEIFELVISLYLTQETVEKCLTMVNKWFTGELSDNNIDRYID